MVQEYGVTPPEAERLVAAYGEPTVPFGKDEVTTERTPLTVMLKLPVAVVLALLAIVILSLINIFFNGVFL